MGYRTVLHEQMELPDDVVFVWEVYSSKMDTQKREQEHESKNGDIQNANNVIR